MDTQPKGGAAAGGLSREETVDRIAEDLLAKARICLLRSLHADVRTAAIILGRFYEAMTQLSAHACSMRKFAQTLELANCNTVFMLLQCPSAVAPEEVAERLQKLPGGPTAPLNVHLRQEVDRLNTVLHIARQTLESLRLAIAGGCCQRF